MFVLEYFHFDQLIIAILIIQSFVLLRMYYKLNRRDKEISGLKNDLEVLLLCDRGMAERIKSQQQLMRCISERQDKLEISEASQVNYKQAITLLKKGATMDELVEACDISRGEIELISHLENLKRQTNHKQAA